MITVRTNIGEITGRLKAKFGLLRNPAFIKDKLLRTIAADVAPLMAHRIHDEGRKADGSSMSEYSTPYLRVRENYGHDKNSKRKVLSLTRKMRNEFGTIPTDNGYGIGFRDGGNPQASPELSPKKGKKQKQITSGQKAKFQEQREGKIYGLTTEEKAQVRNTAEQFIKDFDK